MIIGIPKEIKANENRVAITPAGVTSFVNKGHRIIIEKNAGKGSGFEDNEYLEVGGEIANSNKDVYNSADMILKVKEPLPSEYRLFREGQILFTYLHLAPENKLTEALLKQGIIGVGYETVQLEDGSLPLLEPMSEVAGRMSIQVGARLLEKINGGIGLLLGGVPGVYPGKVVILGGGTVGINAAKMAVGLGAQVTIFDINKSRMNYINDIFGGRVITCMSNQYNIAESLINANLVVGAVLIPGAKTPKLVTKDMVRKMKKGSVIIDVAIDQGGSIETIDRITTHEKPYFIKYGVLHYSVANMPGAVPRTSTIALTNATMPYVMEIADKGYYKALKDNKALFKGLNVYKGDLVCKAVAIAQRKPFVELKL